MSDNDKEGIVDKVINNKLLLLVQRLSMLLIVPLVMSTITYFWWLTSSSMNHEWRLDGLDMLAKERGVMFDKINEKLQMLDERTIAILQSIARLETKINIASWPEPAIVPPRIAKDVKSPASDD